MNYNIDTFKNDMPSINSTYGALDIVGQTFGRYLDYQKETAMIEHATQKLKHQTKIILREIDSELTKSLDSNKKSFKLEMTRLKSIAQDIKSNSKNEREIISHIGELTKQLSNPNIPIEIKQNIPQLIALAHQSLAGILSKSGASIDAMSNFNTKQIKG